jgi:hypothetical protein
LDFGHRGSDTLAVNPAEGGWFHDAVSRHFEDAEASGVELGTRPGATTSYLDVPITEPNELG